jgi:hypothetical protein
VSLVAARVRLRLRGLDYVERSEREIPRERLTVMDACFAAAVGLGLVDSVRGAALQTRHLLLALDSGEPHRVARGLAAEAIYSAAARPGAPRTRRVVGEVVRLAERLGEAHPRAMGFAIQGISAYLEGRFPAAAERCARAEALLRDECRGVAFDLGSVQLFALSALAYLGRLREVRRRVPALVREARQRGDLYTATALRTGVRNVAWLAAGDVAGASAEVDEAMRDWSKSGFHVQHFFALLARTQIDLYRGDGSAALARVQDGWPALAGALLLRVRFFRVEIPELRARAALAAALAGNDRSALGAVERDARRIEREPLPWAAPMAKLLNAGAAAARNQRARAAELYRGAALELDAAGMAIHATVARRRLGELLGAGVGRELVRVSDARMAEEEIADPEAFARMLAPSPA